MMQDAELACSIKRIISKGEMFSHTYPERRSGDSTIGRLIQQRRYRIQSHERHGRTALSQVVNRAARARSHVEHARDVEMVEEGVQDAQSSRVSILDILMHVAIVICRRAVIVT